MTEVMGLRKQLVKYNSYIFEYLSSRHKSLNLFSFLNTLDKGLRKSNDLVFNFNSFQSSAVFCKYIDTNQKLIMLKNGNGCQAHTLIYPTMHWATKVSLCLKLYIHSYVSRCLLGIHGVICKWRRQRPMESSDTTWTGSS